MVCPACHATGRQVHTKCPVCGMVFIFCLVRHVVGRLPLFLCFAFNQCHVTGWLVYTLCPACHVTGRPLIPRPDPVYTIITRDPPLRGLHGICAEKLSTAWALGSSWSVPMQIQMKHTFLWKTFKHNIKKKTVVGSSWKEWSSVLANSIVRSQSDHHTCHVLLRIILLHIFFISFA